MPGSRARRCFVVGGLPHVAGNIGPSRERPQHHRANPTMNSSGTSVGAEASSTKDIGERTKAHSRRVIRVLEGGGHTHPQRPPFKQTSLLCCSMHFFTQNRFFDRFFGAQHQKKRERRTYPRAHMNEGGPGPQLCALWDARSRKNTTHELKTSIPRARLAPPPPPHPATRNFISGSRAFVYRKFAGVFISLI